MGKVRPCFTHLLLPATVHCPNRYSTHVYVQHQFMFYTHFQKHFCAQLLQKHQWVCDFMQHLSNQFRVHIVLHYPSHKQSSFEVISLVQLLRVGLTICTQYQCLFTSLADTRIFILFFCLLFHIQSYHSWINLHVNEGCTHWKSAFTFYPLPVFLCSKGKQIRINKNRFICIVRIFLIFHNKIKDISLVLNLDMQSP